MRRGSRTSWLAVLAWVLGCSVLTVLTVPGASGAAVPASEARSSEARSAEVRAFEGGVDESGDRVLAGADRYATAVALAERAVRGADSDVAGGVVVVSGESLVDALSAVPLAVATSSVVVLTRPAALPEVVAEFVRSHGAGRVLVVGGTTAVSEAVVEQLGGLAGVGVVDRFAGADRYATAVAVAREAGLFGGWCGELAPAVLVVSGQSLVDGVLAAPVADAMGLPVLFTRADALPDVVRGYVRDAGVGRAVVIGSEAEVSASVAAERTASGAAVTRMGGATPAARSVALADAVRGCGAAAGEFALVDAAVPVDGVTAAALLANGIDADRSRAGGGLVPLLAVDRELPADVAEHLARRAATTVGEIRLYALGGTARITAELMRDALDAASHRHAVSSDLTDDGERADDEVAEPRERVSRSSATRPPVTRPPVTGPPATGPPVTAPPTRPPVVTPTATTQATPATTTTAAPSTGSDLAAASGGRGLGFTESEQRADEPEGVSVAPVVDELGPFVVVRARVGATSIRLLTLEEHPSTRLVEAAPDEDDVTLVLGGTDVSVRLDGSNPYGVGVFAAGPASDVDEGYYVVHRPDGTVEAAPVAWGRLWDVGWGCPSRASAVSDCAGTPALSYGDRIAVAEGALIDAYGNRSPAESIVLTDPNAPATTSTTLPPPTTTTTLPPTPSTTTTTSALPPSTTTTSALPPTTTTSALPPSTTTTSTTLPPPSTSSSTTTSTTLPPPTTTSSSTTTSTTLSPPPTAVPPTAVPPTAVVDDDVKPLVVIEAVPGRNFFRVRTEEDNPSDEPEDKLELDEFTLWRNHRPLKLREGPDGQIVDNPSRFALFEGADAAGAFVDFSWECPPEAAGPADCGAPAFVGGEALVVWSGAFRDRAGNENVATTARVAGPVVPTEVPDDSVLADVPTLSGVEYSYGDAFKATMWVDVAEMNVRGAYAGTRQIFVPRIRLTSRLSYTHDAVADWRLSLVRLGDDADDDAGDADDAGAPHGHLGDNPHVTVVMDEAAQQITVSYDDDASVVDIYEALRDDAAVEAAFEVVRIGYSKLTTEVFDPLDEQPVPPDVTLIGRWADVATNRFGVQVTLNFDEPVASFDLDGFMAGQDAHAHNPLLGGNPLSAKVEPVGGSWPAASIVLTLIFREESALIDTNVPWAGTGTAMSSYCHDYCTSLEIVNLEFSSASEAAEHEVVDERLVPTPAAPCGDGDGDCVKYVQLSRMTARVGVMPATSADIATMARAFADVDHHRRSHWERSLNLPAGVVMFASGRTNAAETGLGVAVDLTPVTGVELCPSEHCAPPLSTMFEAYVVRRWTERVRS